MDIAQKESTEEIHNLSSTTQEVIDQIELDRANAQFYKTGFTSIDDYLDGGFLKQELIILGAMTGLGKSTVAGQIMYNIARQGVKTAYFSLEISNEMIVSRLIGGMARLKPIRIRLEAMPPFDAGEIERKKSAERELLNYEEWMHFYDEVYAIQEMISEIKKHKYGFIVIDFIQNIIGGPSDEYSRLSEAALVLQKVAKETDCCILILSQLSNSAAKDPGTGVLEYKGSGSIATVCDLGFVIGKKDTDFNENTRSLESVTLTLRKNRRGISGGEFTLLYDNPGGWISDGGVRVVTPKEPIPTDTKEDKKRTQSIEGEIVEGGDDNDRPEIPF